MTRFELEEKCQDRIDYLTNELEKKSPEYEFYSKITRAYNFKSLGGLVKIPYIELFTAVFYAESDAFPIMKIFSDVVSFSSVFYKLTYTQLGKVNAIIFPFASNDDIDVLKNAFNKIDKEEAINSIMNFLWDKKIEKTDFDVNMLRETEKIITLLVGSNNKEDFNVVKLLDYYQAEPILCHNIFDLIKALKNIENDPELYNGRIRNEDKIKEKYNVADMFKLTAPVMEYSKYLCSHYKDIKSRQEAELNRYKRFLRDIKSAFEKDEIKNYSAIIENFPDSELKVEFLQLVYEHNNSSYEKLDAKKDNLIKNSIINYLNVLKTHGINKEEVNLERIMKNSCEDLTKMLKILNALVGDKNTIIKIIEMSDLESVNYFKDLKSKSILTKDAFIMYPELFNPNSSERTTLDNSIKLINDYKINASIFSNTPSIMINNEMLYYNLEVLKQYNFINVLKGLNNYNFLSNSNLIKTIDKILELGYEDLLENDLTLLNENNWDRIYVLKSMGLLPLEKEELIKYLRSDKFFVPDKKINLYVDDASKYYKDIDYDYDVNSFNILKDKEKTSRVLMFGDTIISKNKVLRSIDDENMNIKDLFKAIIKDSILNMNEIDSIKCSICEKTYKKN